MTGQYDVVIIGGGHNGLVAAAVLAKAGRSVLVLEARSVLGGAASTEEVFPGFRVNTGADDASLFRDEIVRELFLPMHNLQFRESPAALFAPQPDGRALTLWRDEASTVAALAAFSREDARRYPGFVAEVNRMASIVSRMLLLTPPDLGAPTVSDALPWGQVGLAVRRLGDRPMMDLLRVLPIPVKGYLDSWFVSDAVKGAVGAGGITGLHQGPRAAGTTLMLLYQHACGFPGGRFVLGGIGQLSQALADAARTNGAEIRTEAPVVQILVEDSKVTGVALAEGTAIKATVVMSSTTPETTFFRLVGPQRLPPSFMRQARNIIYRGSTAKVNLALSGLPQFRGQTSVEQLSGRIRISPSLDYLERAYDEAKYGRMSRRPYLEAVIPTLVDPLLAPPGHHILSITMRYAPSRLRDGSWEAERESLGDLVVDTLAEYAPGLETLIQQRQVITPWDWQQQYGLTEGGIHHGQMGLDQLLVMRPVPGWGRYRTPLANLYLCGSGAHPGGGVTGAPGYNAARTVEAALRGG